MRFKSERPDPRKICGNSQEHAERIGADLALKNSDSISVAHGEALRRVVDRAGAICRCAVSFRFLLASVHDAVHKRQTMASTTQQRVPATTGTFQAARAQFER